MRLSDLMKQMRNSTKVYLTAEDEIVLMAKAIRTVERFISKVYVDQRMRCPVHLSVGQELIPSALSYFLKSEDHIVSNHRCHAHYLSKDGCIRAMFGELMGLPQGCCAGRGGSMHLFDLEVGMFPAIPIVGSCLPVAVGSAWAQKIDGTNSITVAYVGDSILETGSFLECINISSLYKLPLLMVVEDNDISTYSQKRTRQAASASVEGIADTFGIHYKSVDAESGEFDGGDFAKFIDYCRGSNTMILHSKAYRRLEHCGPNDDSDLKYRAVDEALAWDRSNFIDMYFHGIAENSVKGEISQILNHDLEIFLNHLYKEFSSYQDIRVSEYEINK